MLHDPNPRAVLGANHPPSLEETLRERHADLLTSAEAMKKKLRALPKFIGSDKDSERYVGAIVDAGKVIKAAKEACDEEVEPFLRDSKVCYALFNAELRDSLAPFIKAAKDLNDAYLAEKVAREREEQRQAAELLRLRAENMADAAKHAEDEGQNRVADANMSAAAALEQQADAAEARASSSSNHLSATVTASGAKASVSMVWAASNVNRDILDLEALRPYLSDEALEKALAAFVKAGRRSIRGATIGEKPRGNYR